MLARVWRSRLTWRTSIGLTAVACLAFLATAGLEGTAGTIFAVVFFMGWFVLMIKMADNEARHVVQLARQKGTPAPKRQLRTLLVPWWARACGAFAVLGVTVVAIRRFDDGLAALTFVLALAAAWLIQKTVIALRSPRD
jgi:hypothetical protein